VWCPRVPLSVASPWVFQWNMRVLRIIERASIPTGPRWFTSSEEEVEEATKLASRQLLRTVGLPIIAK
jgi:hypothetical protein